MVSPYHDGPVSPYFRLPNHEYLDERNSSLVPNFFDRASINDPTESSWHRQLEYWSLRDDLNKAELRSEVRSAVHSICRYIEAVSGVLDDGGSSELHYFVEEPVSDDKQLVSEWIRLLDSMPHYLDVVSPTINHLYQRFKDSNTNVSSAVTLKSIRSPQADYALRRRDERIFMHNQELSLQDQLPLSTMAELARISGNLDIYFENPFKHDLLPHPMSQGPRRATSRPEESKGVWHYEWPEGRKRIWYAVSLREEELPGEALARTFSRLESICTSSTVDIRLLGDLEITAVEPLTVSIVLNLYNKISQY